MLKALCNLATTWPFVVSVLMLIGNDVWLKYAHPGIVSGKLSDFAGVAIVTLLLLAATKNRHRLTYGAVAIGFAWWKSPGSQSFIDAMNVLLPFSIGRTVDYTDLIALLVMPACVAVAARPEVFAIPHRTVRRLLLGPVILLTTFGLMATSAMPTRQGYQIRATEPATGLDRERIADTIEQVAAKHGLACHDCSSRTMRAHFSGNGLRLRYTFTGASAISFEVEALSNGLFFGATGVEKADALRSTLKSHLASLYKDLEYVEQLNASKLR